MNLGGRPNLIESPEELEKLANEYMQWVKDNPVIQLIKFRTTSSTHTNRVIDYRCTQFTRFMMNSCT